MTDYEIVLEEAKDLNGAYPFKFIKVLAAPVFEKFKAEKAALTGGYLETIPDELTPIDFIAVCPDADEDLRVSMLKELKQAFPERFVTLTLLSESDWNPGKMLMVNVYCKETGDMHHTDASDTKVTTRAEQTNNFTGR